MPDGTTQTEIDLSDTHDAQAEVAAIAEQTLEVDTAVVPDKTFADYGVQPEIAAALERKGITHPFPIQAMTLPVALAGHDIIGQAKTGTGKTLGFGIPLLQRVAGPGEPGFDQLAVPGAPQALIVVPTRELAGQVAGDIEAAAALRAARVLTVYGGRAYEPQIDALAKGIEIVVGTPGRLIDLAQQGHLDLGHTRCVVLDEADEMLDLGFLPDVEKLLSQTPAGRHTMLFSATMPGAVVALARRYMTQPTHIRAADPHDDGATVAAVRKMAYRAHAMDKVEMLARVLQARDRGLSIVFARTKRTAAKVADELADRGFAAASIHGDLGQGAREQALRAFRNGKVDVLVATDVAARGIDVENVTHVVNYQCPEDEKTFLHRIGRTGRAEKTGTAITFVDWDDLHRWTMINRALDLGIADPPETYSTSAHLFSDLDIPAGVTGRLPHAQRTREGLNAENLEDLGGKPKTAKAPAARRSDSKGPGRASEGHSLGGRNSEGRSSEGRSSEGRSSEGRSSEGRSSEGRSRGRGGRGEQTPDAAPQTAAEAPPAAAAAGEDAPRRRRRTRSGSGSAELTAASATTVPASSATTSAPASDPSGGEAATGPRRRRRRGGRGRSGGGADRSAPTVD